MEHKDDPHMRELLEAVESCRRIKLALELYPSAGGRCQYALPAQATDTTRRHGFKSHNHHILPGSLSSRSTYFLLLYLGVPMRVGNGERTTPIDLMGQGSTTMLLAVVPPLPPSCGVPSHDTRSKRTRLSSWRVQVRRRRRKLNGCRWGWGGGPTLCAWVRPARSSSRCLRTLSSSFSSRDTSCSSWSTSGGFQLGCSSISLFFLHFFTLLFIGTQNRNFVAEKKRKPTGKKRVEKTKPGVGSTTREKRMERAQESPWSFVLAPRSFQWDAAQLSMRISHAQGGDAVVHLHVTKSASGKVQRLSLVSSSPSSQSQSPHQI